MVDWWAFGVMIFEMFHGIVPFQGKNKHEIFENIKYQDPLISPSINEKA